MTRFAGLAITIAVLLAVPLLGASARSERPPLRVLDPPEQGFFARELEYEGIPIKAPAVVADQALYVARDRLERLLQKLPDAVYNLRVAGAELHIIGKDQVTSDLPEHRHLKGKPFDGKLTVDQRTRGLGGLLTSCGEENLLGLPGDRYAGRDICTHEFAHNLQDHGLSADVRERIRMQYRRSLELGLWKGAYAGTNVSEYFAELTMWYFGTQGDRRMTGPKPADGPEGLRKYDPEAFALLDDLYQGRIPVTRVRVTELKPEAPERERELRSPEAGAAATVRFRNRTGQELRLFWIDGAGKRQAYGTLAPGAARRQETSAGHVWLLAAPDDRTVALFVAVPGTGLATIQR
jgi:hypothetical protein